jgi:CRISPR-associated protein Cmr5
MTRPAAAADESKKTTDQKRATHAWDVVQKAKQLSEKEKKEFGTQARKLPTRILASGLGPALAFLEAKKYSPDLIGGLAEWIHLQRPARSPADTRLVVRIIHEDAEFLRYATTECLAYLQWLVRFAEAENLIPKDNAE